MAGGSLRYGFLALRLPLWNYDALHRGPGSQAVDGFGVSYLAQTPTAIEHKLRATSGGIDKGRPAHMGASNVKM